MNEPRRLLEDPATNGRLFEALRGYPAPVEIAPQALQALGHVLGESVVSTVAAPAGVGVLAKVGAAKILIAVVAAGAGTVGVCVWAGHANEHSQVVAVTSSAVAAFAERARVLPPTTPSEAVRVEELAVESEIRPSPGGHKPLVSMGSRSQLKDEAMLLEVARSALASDPNRALEQTTVHRLRFARPLLSLERDLVEIDALCRLGRRDQAAALVNGVLVRQPQGMYAERARALLHGCGSKSGGPVKDASELGNQ